jgi:hypothetical protein
MALTSHDAEDALITGAGSDLALGALDGTGVKGLALAAGPLRRPFATSGPLLDPSDWVGVRFRTFHSEIESAAISALGGTPVDAGVTWSNLALEGRLGGVELDIAQYAANGFSDEAPYVTTNVVLWPKVLVLAMSKDRFDSLTDQQRDWVLEAAQAARQASLDGSYDDDASVIELCGRGVSFRPATDQQLTRLRKALTPIWAQLEGEAAESALMAAVRSIADRFPEPEAPTVPDGCKVDKEHPGPASVLNSRRPSELPDGVYRVEIPTSVVEDAGVSNGPGWSGTWTLRVRGATYALYCRPLDAPGKDCGNVLRADDGAYEAGFLRGAEHSVAFVSNAKLLSSLTGCDQPASMDAGHCETTPTYAVTWTLNDDILTFGDIAGSDAFHLTLRPWRRIGSERGTTAATVVPPAGGLVTSSRPSRRARRSLRPRSPEPRGSAPPTPSSVTVRRRSYLSVVTLTSIPDARACFCAFTTASDAT